MVHDVCARPGQFHVGRGEAEAFGIFAQVGEQARLLAFELEAQAHDGVHVAHGFLAVRVDRDGPVVHARGQEGARGAQADVHAELGEQQYVGAADAAVGAVTEDKQVFALEGVPVVSPDLTQGKGVEQGLGGMRVPAVPGVDHAAVQSLGEELGRAAAGMADDDDIGVHGLEGQGRILYAFAFLEAGTGFRQPEGVGGKALTRHVKRGLGAGARFGEEEDDAFSLEDGDFLDWPGVDFVQVCGSIKQVEKFFLRQLVHIQQVFVRPMEGFLLHGGFSGVDVGACRLGRPIAYRRKTEKLKKNPAGTTGNREKPGQCRFGWLRDIRGGGG